MADATFEAERLAEIMARINEEMRRYGEVSAYTQRDLLDAQVRAKTGLKNFSAAADKGADVVGALAGAAMSAGKAMLDGKKGAAAFNESIDGMAKAAVAASAALFLLNPFGKAVGLLIAGVAALATSYAKYTQAANEMADKLSKGYQGLAKAGGAAADGMSGVFRDAKKLGLSMNELDQMVSLVAENAKDFALFAGSVSEGRKRFADLSETMKPARTGLMNMGMSLEEINAASAGYLRLQSRIGQTQNKTTAELAESTRRYLYEQDALTKLTGMTRKEQEAAREEIRSQERFAAVLQQMRAKGQVDAAKQLEDAYLLLRSQSKDAAQGFADIQTGNLQTEAAQQSMRVTQGESLRSGQQIQAGMATAVQGAQNIASAYGRTAEQLGQLGLVGQFDKTFGSLNGAIQLGVFSQQDINKQYAKIIADQKAQAEGRDAMTAKQTELVQKQIEANKAVESFIKAGIVPAQEKMILLANATAWAAAGLSKMFYGKAQTETGKKFEEAQEKRDAAFEGASFWTKLGFGLTKEQKAANQELLEARAAHQEDVKRRGQEQILNFIKGLFGGKKEKEGDVPAGADGGLFSGPTSGYLAMLHGTELVVPEDMLKGQVGTVGAAAGLVAKEQGQINLFTKEILKDTETLAKLTDADAKRTQDYSRTQKRLLDLKTKLMEEEINILEEQNKSLEEMANIYERAGGSGGAAGFKKMMRMQNLGLGGVGSQVMSGTGTGVTSGTGLPVTSGPSGGLDEFLMFGDRSGSKANFQALDNSLQNAVIRAAQEYNIVTGQKIKINSAARSTEDQKRLYAESIASGRPGIGPNGMPIGAPGTSPHEHGRAVDIQNYNDPQAVAAFNRQGLFQKVPSDPVHFTFESGGIVSGPRSGYGATLHGDEAVIPLNNNAGNFVKLFESLAENNRAMVSMMQEMVSAQKTSVDVQQKMLRMAT